MIMYDSDDDDGGGYNNNDTYGACNDDVQLKKHKQEATHRVCCQD